MLLEIILYGLLCGSLSILAEEKNCQLPEWPVAQIGLVGVRVLPLNPGVNFVY